MTKLTSQAKLIVLLAGFLVAATLFVNCQPVFPMQVAKCNILQEGGKQYVPYEGVNPFYVRFDGYGNGKYVYAILCKEQVKGKIILLIVSPKDCKKWVILVKTSFVSIDDFSWCHEINVFSKESVNQILSNYKDKKINAHGEGVMLSPGETEGFLVYWNGSEWTISSTDIGL